MTRLRDIATRLADWTDGFKTHLANVGTFVLTIWQWRKGSIPDVAAVSILATTAVSSLFRLVANQPGHFSRAAALPESEDLQEAVRESQAVDVQKNA